MLFKWQKLSRKCVSWLSVVGILSSMLIPALGNVAFAADAGSSLRVPTIEEGHLYNNNSANSTFTSWSSYVSYTNLDNYSGVKYDLESTKAAFGEGMYYTYKFDGLQLEFSDITAASKFAIRLCQTTYCYTDNKGLTVAVDANTGTIGLTNYDSTDMSTLSLTNDSLKYANWGIKKLDLAFSQVTGGYNLSVSMGGVALGTINIPSATLSGRANFDATKEVKVFVGMLTTLDTVCINWTGVQGRSSNDPVMIAYDAIAALGSISTADVDDIVAANSKAIRLNTAQTAILTNMIKPLNITLSDLANSANVANSSVKSKTGYDWYCLRAMTRADGYLYQKSSLNNNVLTAWSNGGALVMNDLLYGGMSMAFGNNFGAQGGVAEGTAYTYNLDGMTLDFSNLTNKMAITFASNATAYGLYPGNTNLRFVVDPTVGQIALATYNTTSTTYTKYKYDNWYWEITSGNILVDNSDAVKSLTNSTFRLQFVKTDTGYNLTLYTGSQEIVMPITNAQLAQANLTADLTNCRPFISNYYDKVKMSDNNTGRYAFSVNWLGIMGNSTNDPVIPAYKALLVLGDVATADASAVLTAYNYYKVLSAAQVNALKLSLNNADVAIDFDLLTSRANNWIKEKTGYGWSDLRPIGINDGYLYTKNNSLVTGWKNGGHLVVSDLTGGGVSMAFGSGFGCVANVHEGLNFTNQLDGLTMDFSNLSAKMALSFVDQNNVGQYGMINTASNLKFVIDPAQGQVALSTYNAANTYWEITDGNILVNNNSVIKSLTSNKFRIQFIKTDSGYNINIYAGTQEVNMSITSAQLGLATAVDTTKDIFTFVSPYYDKISTSSTSGAYAMSVNWLGFIGKSADDPGDMSAYTHIPLDKNSVKYVGRTSLVNSALTLDWSASGVEFSYYGTDAKVQMTFTDTASSKPGCYVSVYVNDVKTQIIELKYGQKWYTVSTGTDPTVKTTVKIVKQNEMQWNYSSLTDIAVLGTVGERPADKAMKIQIIGDSITAGQGVLGINDDFVLSEEDATATYGYIMAKQFDADVEVVAQSGIGVYMGSGKSTTNQMPVVYTKAYPRRSYSTIWDYTTDHPDVVVINLGSNDYFQGADDASVYTAVQNFLTQIRSYHPNATIFWAYGLMSNYKWDNIKAAVDNWSTTNNDGRAFFVELPNMSTLTSTVGGAGHPNAEAQSKAGDYLYRQMYSVIGTNPEKFAIESINKIGTVTLDSKAAIDQARAEYDKLSPENQALVDNYDILLQAEAKYDDLLVGVIVDKIASIGTVTLDSAQKIRDARDSYDELSSTFQANVTNYDVLTTAEADFKALTDADDTDLTFASNANRIIYNTQASLFTGGWKSSITISEISQGLRYAFTNASTNVREGIKVAEPLDGMFMQFDNYSKTTNSDNFVVFVGNDTKWGGQYSTTTGNPLAIVFNTSAGTITAVNSNNTIITSDLLKYENLRKQRFSIQFNACEGGYTVTVTVGDKSVIGTLSTADITACTTLTNLQNCYVTLSAWGSSQSFNLDFIGVANHYVYDPHKDIVDIINRIDALGTVTLDTASELRAIQTIYDRLGAENQPLVTNYQHLVSAWNSYNALIVALDDNLYVPNDASRIVKNMSSTLFTNVWKDQIIVTDLATLGGNGLRYTFTGGSTNVREGFDSKQSLNNLFIQFDNLNRQDIVSGQFAIFLCNQSAGDYVATGTKTLALVLDSLTGTLKSYPSGNTIISSDLLKYSNISGKRFSVYFQKLDSGDYSVTMKIGTQTVSGTLALSDLAQLISYDTNADQYVELSSWGSQYLTVDLLGWYCNDGSDPIGTVVNMINAIGTVNINDAHALHDAEYAYNNLSLRQQSHISNINVLQQKLAEYHQLCLQADSKYKSIGFSNMLLKGSTDADIQKTMTQWKSSLIYAEQADNAGVRVDFNSTGMNYRDGISGTYMLDGFSLTLDNLIGSGQFALCMCSNNAKWGAQYTIGGSSNPLALAFDTTNGTITAYPNEHVVIQSDLLKYENLHGRRFTISFKYIDSTTYKLTITVGNQSVTGTINNDDFLDANALSDNDKVTFTINSWSLNGAKQTFGLTLASYHYTDLQNVMNLIDNIGVVNGDSGEAIRIAQEAYKSLSPRLLNYIANYDTLEQAINTYQNLDKDSSVNEVINAIDAIDINDVKTIQYAQHLYDWLTNSWKPYVTNYSALVSATEEYENMIADRKYLIDVAGAPLISSDWWQGTTWVKENWGDRMTLTKYDNGVAHIEWKNAITNIRDGANDVYEFDGLHIKLANINLGSNGTNKLGMIIGSSGTDGMGWMQYSSDGSSGMALVLDAVAGTLSAYPGGAVVVSGDCLKYTNLQSKGLELYFYKTTQDSFVVEVTVGNDVLRGTLPSGAILQSKYMKTACKSNVGVLFTPWGNVDSMSVDIVSIYSGKCILESIAEMESLINTLPNTITENDQRLIESVNSKYMSMDYFVRKYINNYDRLSSAIRQINELNSKDIISRLKDYISSHRVGTKTADTADNTSSEITNNNTDTTSSDNSNGSDTTKSTVKDQSSNTGYIFIILGAAVIVIAGGFVFVFRKKIWRKN